MTSYIKLQLEILKNTYFHWFLAPSYTFFKKISQKNRFFWILKNENGFFASESLEDVFQELESYYYVHVTPKTP